MSNKDDTEWLAVLPHAWGRGDDKETAIRKAVPHVPDLDKDEVKMGLYEVRGDWKINDLTGQVVADEFVTEKVVMVEVELLERLDKALHDVSVLTECAVYEDESFEDYEEYLDLRVKRERL